MLYDKGLLETLMFYLSVLGRTVKGEVGRFGKDPSSMGGRE